MGGLGVLEIALIAVGAVACVGAILVVVFVVRKRKRTAQRTTDTAVATEVHSTPLSPVYKGASNALTESTTPQQYAPISLVGQQAPAMRDAGSFQSESIGYYGTASSALSLSQAQTQEMVVGHYQPSASAVTQYQVQAEPTRTTFQW